jgi:hypothetical protein
VLPTASTTVPDALRSWIAPVSAMPVVYTTSPGTLPEYKPPLPPPGWTFVNRYDFPAGSETPLGTVARALAALPVLLEPQICQPPMLWALAETLWSWTSSSLPPVGPRNATCEITTVLEAAFAPGASSAPASTISKAIAGRRSFTARDSLPCIDDGRAHRIGAPDAGVTVP